jgi:nitroimidazol reductase NimA-like FMN-containing flavoprotein (pyridoxamine 5'-phosphate oxidase superfamily)
MSATNSPRTTVKRHAERGHYDRDTINAILDEGLVAHVGFVVDGQPYVIPTLYARIGDTLYFHGAVANRMLVSMADGIPVCATVTLLDGLVLARSHYSHSANYRSVVLLGRARDVSDREERLQSFEALVDHIAKGRWQDARKPSEIEIRTTRVLALPIAEASAKVRTGPPKDDADDLGLPVWAGVIPFETVARPAIPAPELDPSLPMPEYARNYRRAGWPKP